MSTRQILDRIGVGGLTTVAVLALYVATSCPTVYFGDSGELIAAADSLGVAHPPGYPIYTALARIALELPGGEPAWRVNLLSALFGAAVCGGVAHLVRRWTATPLAAIAAGLGLAGAFEFWAVSTVAEVYTFHLFLVVGLLLTAERWARSTGGAARERLLLTGALLMGVGLAHRPSILLMVPALLLLCRRGRGAEGGRPGSIGVRGVLWGVAAALVVGVPILAYGWMMLRAAGEPAVNWGRADHPAALVSHVTTRAYRFYVMGLAGWLRPDAWSRALAVVFQGFGYVGLPLAGLGLAANLSRRSPMTRAATAVSALGLAWLGFGLAYGTEDVEVLFLPCLLATALGAGLGLGTLARLSGSRGWGFLAPAIALAALPIAINYSAADLSGTAAGEDYGRDMLSTVPPDGVLFVEGDDAFLLAYLQQVVGERPDVTIYDRNGVLFRNLLDEPGTSPRPGENSLFFRVRREQEWVTQFAALRPIQFMSWPGYALPPSWRFEPEGLFYRALPAASPWLEPDALWEGYHADSVQASAERTGNPFARTVAATYPLMRGERALFEGQTDAALEWFDRATGLAESETIHNYLGTVFGRMGELERARDEFRRAIRLKPVSVRAWNNLARAELLSGDPAAAIRAWESSLSIEPDQPETRRLLRQYSDTR